MEASAEARAAFGDAVERRLMELGQTRGWLGAAVARIEKGDEATPYTQSAVSQWIMGQSEPARAKVFAIERALDVPPGSLSRILGYLPVEAKAVRSVLDAIDHDHRLNETARAMLRSSYQSALRLS